MALTVSGGGDAGGVTSLMTGGNIGDGVRIGLIVAGLNHAADMVENITEARNKIASTAEKYNRSEDRNVNVSNDNLM